MLSLFRSSHPPSQTIDNADVDVTPVMNVFIILIPFLVSMAVFTHHAIVEFSLPRIWAQVLVMPLRSLFPD